MTTAELIGEKTHRLRHTLRGWTDPAFRPLPTALLVHRLLAKQKLPKLTGEKIFIITDTSYKNDHTYDALVCTDEEGLLRWTAQNRLFRKKYPNFPRVHYKKLKRDQNDWEAVQFYLRSTNVMQGIAAVIATPTGWIGTDVNHIRRAKASGLSRTRHAWPKEHSYAGLVNVASMAAALARPFVRAGMSVHWFSDTEPPLRNPAQRIDINNAFLHALDVTIPARLGPSTLEVKEDLPNQGHWKSDLFGIPDMLAGGVGDALNALKHAPEDNRMLWDPALRSDLTQRESVVFDWFYGPRTVGPVRMGIKLEETGFDGVKLHRTANWFRSPDIAST